MEDIILVVGVTAFIILIPVILLHLKDKLLRKLGFSQGRINLISSNYSSILVLIFSIPFLFYYILKNASSNPFKESLYLGLILGLIPGILYLLNIKWIIKNWDKNQQKFREGLRKDKGKAFLLLALFTPLLTTFFNFVYSKESPLKYFVIGFTASILLDLVLIFLVLTLVYKKDTQGFRFR